MWWIMGCSRHVFYRVVGHRNEGGQGKGGSSSGTSMMSVMRDENREGEAIECGHFRRGGGEAAPQCCRRITQ
jgi:hypothetical protein